MTPNETTPVKHRADGTPRTPYDSYLSSAPPTWGPLPLGISQSPAAPLSYRAPSTPSPSICSLPGSQLPASVQGGGWGDPASSP